MIRRWTTNDESFLRDYYPKRGAGWCANHLGRSSSAIMSRAFKRGLKLFKKNSTHKKLTEADELETTRLYVEERLSARQIGEQFGVKPGCVYSALKRKGIVRDHTGTRNRRWMDEEEAKIVSRYPNESTTELAFAYNTSMSTILKVLDRHNVLRHKSSGGYRLYNYTDRIGRVIKMRSGWEALAAFHLDSLALDWEYETETYTLSISDSRGNPCHYTPDFWTYSHDGRILEVIDVKGRRTKKQDRLIAAFCCDYPNIPFIIWDERHLKSLGFTWKDLRYPKLIVGDRLQKLSG